ncbi:hypothetical protein BGZ95_006354 [Linnemannia exigua]|uniref:Uncharacterized protein n=1 Tax=Linnemannia exigua TaxID=604196 RepID=A0AAD4D119_9FUNG|nr:hypothetical protein BGZ95_006354 [Linnemannia exigua]
MKSIAIGMAEMLQSQKADYICLEFDKFVKDRTLQLCIDGAFRKAKATGGLLEKCQEIVGFLKSCGAAKKPLDAERKRLNKKIYKFVAAAETRWNSSLTLMRGVCDLAGEMAVALEVLIASSVQSEVDRAKRMKPGLLSEQERGEVNGLCKLLTPAAKLTNEVGSSKYPIISSAYPKISGLLPALTTFVTGPAKEMSDALIQEIEQRFTVHQMPDVTLVAMF